MIPELLLAIPGISLDNTDPGDVSTTLQLLLMLTVLSLAPGILIMMTSFTRIIIVLSFVRTGLGTQSMPPNQVLVGLALFLTFFIMAPVATEMNDTALQPYLDEELTQEEALDAAMLPIKEFMAQHTREKDLALFFKYAELEKPDDIEGIPLTSLVPAFALSELKTAFQIGFVIFIPFLIIDMVVASTLMAMGMMMLPPVMISLPFKILLFVLVDGWYLIIESLLVSF
ncbi:flagellar type III secretion system pore protein FliP [Planococcus sp. CP5-4]|uniref:flagellar type III secretion system pore protein FliP n=1 Tax=unclassified Planococcus (in: firmicutes) TaxID=2662419 RepID=UPI001C22CFEF|nr:MULTISPECIES: flagellar type III secretion system pore protein FliP [unclassified Planococcus (in: firmicutes)]MBU9672590.1 flagellar type III secretion system pore protein FliP [Planococcus sp. CP5-4_YE]MBV0909640.1 flagellar type III secretion system pore protein FliP [Planococcus sp. CP5-4_UN]MBW6064370.1 flagellar type III secretion system pore protein FliP [Planococcus sp. CP5-4]